MRIIGIAPGHLCGLYLQAENDFGILMMRPRHGPQCEASNVSKRPNGNIPLWEVEPAVGFEPTTA